MDLQISNVSQRLVSTRLAVKFFGGGANIIRRARIAGWLRPVDGKERGICYYDIADLNAVIDRLKAGEHLPDLPSKA